MQSHTGSGLGCGSRPPVPISVSEGDFHQLAQEKLITFQKAPGPCLTGKPTQLGIETAASLRAEPVPNTATSNETGRGEPKPSEARLDGPLGSNPFPPDHLCHQLWIDMMANTAPSRGSVLADSLVQNRNPFPEGTREHRIWKDVHEIWKDTGLWAKEHRALFHSEMLESMPPEEASEKEFLDHILKARAGVFDIWAGALSRHAVLTDDAAEAFEHLLDEVEKVMIAQAGNFRASFLPEPLFSSELRNRLNQRKQYWIGQMLRRVREHKEATRAGAVGGPGIRSGQPAVGTDPTTNEVSKHWAGDVPELRTKLEAGEPPTSAPPPVGVGPSPAEPSDDASRTQGPAKLQSGADLGATEEAEPSSADRADAAKHQKIMEGEITDNPSNQPEAAHRVISAAAPLNASYLQILHEAMDHKGLNPPKLAKKMRVILRRKKGNRTKVDRTTVYRIMQGDTKKPQPEVREALVEVLGLQGEKASQVRRGLGAAGAAQDFSKQM